jgi:hypothetical protein
VGGFVSRDKREEASARLAAAAADLLEACREALHGDGCLPVATVEMLRRAIAKATGGAA